MAQQNISFGAYPGDLNADTTRLAFEKAQANFTDLYANGIGGGAAPNGTLTLSDGSVITSLSAGLTVTRGALTLSYGADFSAGIQQALNEAPIDVSNQVVVSTDGTSVGPTSTLAAAAFAAFNPPAPLVPDGVTIVQAGNKVSVKTQDIVNTAAGAVTPSTQLFISNNGTIAKTTAAALVAGAGVGGAAVGGSYPPQSAGYPVNGYWVTRAGFVQLAPSVNLTVNTYPNLLISLLALDLL